MGLNKITLPFLLLFGEGTKKLREIRVLGWVPQSRGFWGFCQRDAVRVSPGGTWLGEGRKKGVSQPPSKLTDLAVVRPVLVDLCKELPVLRSSTP